MNQFSLNPNGQKEASNDEAVPHGNAPAARSGGRFVWPFRVRQSLSEVGCMAQACGLRDGQETFVT
jgi:hypothetical protein